MKLKSPFDFKATHIIGALLLAAVLGFGCHPVTASSVQVTEQVTEQDKTEAREIWKAENGEFQPNLTAETEAEILVLVEKMKEAGQ